MYHVYSDIDYSPSAYIVNQVNSRASLRRFAGEISTKVVEVHIIGIKPIATGTFRAKHMLLANSVCSCIV